MPAKKKTRSKKNSLVGNINARKKTGSSRPRARTTVSAEAYDEMKKGWPKSAKTKKRRAATRKRASKSATGPKKKSTKKKTAK